MDYTNIHLREEIQVWDRRILDARNKNLYNLSCKMKKYQVNLWGPKVHQHHPDVGHRPTHWNVILAVDQPSSNYATW
jgi:hypothetical protein